MKQLTQQLKSGKMEIVEVPFPILEKGCLLVRNHFSIISPGTEAKTVSDARKGYIAKAKSRKKEFLQVIDLIKKQGIIDTYKLVMNKLEAPSSLGYSCSGEVIAVSEDVIDFKVGDFVACGGNSASHSDVVSIPINLACKIPDSVDIQSAAMTTLGAIALQGIRQSNLQIGENCLVIGLGLIGQLCTKILEVNGINTIGIDISEQCVDSSISLGIKAFNRNSNGLEKYIQQITGGHGVDSVIICASSSSNDPIEFAGTVCRKKGKIVIVGAIPTGFERKNFYEKELEIKMSHSYGPGRSQLPYEEKGIDYPYAYVRWTENRNMQGFIELLKNKKLDVKPFISHTFLLDDAPQAYELILNKDTAFSAICLQYEKEIPKNKIVYQVEKSNDLNICSLIGAGNYAQNILLPIIKNYFTFCAVLTPKGNISKYVAEKYSFSLSTSSLEDILKDTKCSTVFITSRHDSHAFYVIECIKAQKHIFCEKPLAIKKEELNKIIETIQDYQYNKHLCLGFNRRFAPAIIELKKNLIPNQKKSIYIRVNAGELPLNHWINDYEIGGGRIVGECCHFVDLARHIADSKVVSVSAEELKENEGLTQSIIANLCYENGSVAQIAYLSNGSKELNKEWIEVFCGNSVYQINDFKELKIYTNKIKKINYTKQDKGHKNLFYAFSQAVSHSKNSPIPIEQIFESTEVTFCLLESVQQNRKIHF
ncbi:MAG: bi-domain-containing oxidoreductase [Flavobacteriia bacterium]|nr:bi-domain-containing oxidoreductase [Flavobacteriia bacterium]